MLAMMMASFTVAGSRSAAEEKVHPAYKGLTAVVESLVDSEELRGASLLVIDDGRVVYRKHFGRFTDDTVVLAASASKWLSAAVIMALVDKGKLNLEDPVRKFVPETPEPLASATVRQLFSHTSGLPGIRRGLGTRGGNLTDSAAAVTKMKMVAEPGNVFSYGNASMQLGGRIAEIAGGDSWDNLFQRCLAEPLGLAHTSYRGEQSFWLDGGNPKIAGGVRTSLDDYGRFVEMILHDGQFRGRQILSAASVREMERDHTTGTKKLSFIPPMLKGVKFGIYGLGLWRLAVDPHGEATVVASPGAFGFFPWVDRPRGIAAVFMIQEFRGASLGDRPHEFGAHVVRAVAELHDAALKKSAATTPSPPLPMTGP
jgi:CubicO group peptidase (beta-lactamase class C family)